jgi:hypothetical protein
MIKYRVMVVVIVMGMGMYVLLRMLSNSRVLKLMDLDMVISYAMVKVTATHSPSAHQNVAMTVAVHH